ncbi:hypothetical protein [Lachnoclostridium phytofermentans]|uniref:hypothetical protein n=1 Tax=Lachnoclostridium phytofermentans TaxID=66219 RepID=UPI00068C4C77|nr:hypothetical protein [Lachnoclostridium phytofermentans]
MANRKDEGDYHNVRCSRNNPQHVYVNKILSDLNMDIYKSKNQFIIDAVEAYCRMLNQDDLTVNATIERARKEGYVRRKDLDEIKKDICSRVVKEVQQEVISMLGTALAAKQSVNVTEETIKVKEDNFGEVNDAVVGLATNWVE